VGFLQQDEVVPELKKRNALLNPAFTNGCNELEAAVGGVHSLLPLIGHCRPSTLNPKWQPMTAFWNPIQMIKPARNYLQIAGSKSCHSL